MKKYFLFIAVLISAPIIALRASYVASPYTMSPGELTGQTTTLASGINNSTTSCTVDANLSPAVTAPFEVLIGTEHLRISSTGSGTNWTCLRAYDGTSAASHSMGDTITYLPWQWINQGSSTLDTTQGTFYVSYAAVSGGHTVAILKHPLPIGNYKISTSQGMLCASRSTHDCIFGMVWRESSSGKLHTCQWENASGSTEWFTHTVYWTSPTAPVGDVGLIDNYRQAGFSGYANLRMRYDGVNRYCDISVDKGSTWLNFASTSNSTDLVPDEIGFFVDAYEGVFAGDPPVNVAVLNSWVQQ